jgi:hypothetical protein
VSAQGFFGRLRALVNRAVYALLHPLTAGPLAPYVRQLDPSVGDAEMQRVRREARAGIETAARAGTLQPGQPLSAALGSRQPPAGAVEVWLRYEVITESGARRQSSVVLGRADDPHGQVTWQTTIGEIRSRAQEVESVREGPSDPGTVDWSTAEFIPPLRYPPNP